MSDPFKSPASLPLGSLRAEEVYLFRHALLREAAYQLQLPGERAHLHEVAFEIIEQLFGGRPPEPRPLDGLSAGALAPRAF